MLSIPFDLLINIQQISKSAPYKIGSAVHFAAFSMFHGQISILPRQVANVVAPIHSSSVKIRAERRASPHINAADAPIQKSCVALKPAISSSSSTRRRRGGRHGAVTCHRRVTSENMDCSARIYPSSDMLSLLFFEKLHAIYWVFGNV